MLNAFASKNASIMYKSLLRCKHSLIDNGSSLLVSLLTLTFPVASNYLYTRRGKISNKTSDIID